MKDIDDVLTGFDGISYFIKSENVVEDYEAVWETEPYRKSIRRHLRAMIPSMTFIILFGLLLAVFLNYSPNVIDDLSFLTVILAIMATLVYFIYVDFKKFRHKHNKFIKGNVVGTSKDKEKIITKYYLILAVDSKDLITAQVSKEDYLDAKPNDEYLLFLEATGLFAVKS